MNDNTTLEKLEAMLNKQYVHNFDEEEIEVLNRVIHIVRGFDAFGSLAGFVKNTVLWFGAVIGAFVAIKMNLVEHVFTLFRG